MEAMANSPGLLEDPKAHLKTAIDDIKKSGAISDDRDEQNKKDKKVEIQKENDTLKNNMTRI
jgi:hypothetical protein